MFSGRPRRGRRSRPAAVKAIVDWLCNGSVEEVLVGMMDARMLDGGTLQRPAKRIEQAKEENAEEKAEGKKEGQT
jgi:BlaI family transcriptional regulator, penicillinase repressor